MMGTALHLLSGGAAQGLVVQLQERFFAEGGCAIDGVFGAVGLMKDRLLAGAPCDVLILTEALIAQLTDSGHVVAGSARALGVVKTGLAVKSGEPLPPVASAPDLKAALLAARGIYLPDPVKATAGIHFMKVLQQLGIADEVAGRLCPFPNGMATMGEMAAAEGPGLIGCTQVTEILHTPGVQLAGRLPPVFELATVYSAAVSHGAQQPEIAARLVDLLASAEAAEARLALGFEPRQATLKPAAR